MAGFKAQNTVPCYWPTLRGKIQILWSGSAGKEVELMRRQAFHFTPCPGVLWKVNRPTHEIHTPHRGEWDSSTGTASAWGWNIHGICTARPTFNVYGEAFLLYSTKYSTWLGDNNDLVDESAGPVVVALRDDFLHIHINFVYCTWTRLYCLNYLYHTNFQYLYITTWIWHDIQIITNFVLLCRNVLSSLKRLVIYSVG